MSHVAALQQQLQSAKEQLRAAQRAQRDAGQLSAQASSLLAHARDHAAAAVEARQQADQEVLERLAAVDAAQQQVRFCLGGGARW